MAKFKKKYTNDLLKKVAHAHGVSVAEVKKEMLSTIESARNSPDPLKQAEFKKHFGDRTPTPEEFIYALTKKINR